MSLKSFLDQFYTSPSVVKLFLTIIDSFHFIDADSIFIEPSAGDGKFIDELRQRYPNQILAFDIEKNHNAVIQQDFLTTNLQYSKHNLTIGNPPFGNRAKLAIDFVNHAAKFCDIICFVVPIQFRRWSVQKRINSEFKLIFSSDNLPKNSFLVHNKPVHVNCCLQIWINNKIDKNNQFLDLRIKTAPPNKHPDFDSFIYNNQASALKFFDKAKYQWDFAVVRQGYYDYHERITDPCLLKTNRQYVFIKYNAACSKTVFDVLDFEKLSNSNTTVKGFSNTDLVAEYIKIKKELGVN